MEHEDLELGRAPRRTAPRSSGSGRARSGRGRGRARSSPRRRWRRHACGGRSSGRRTSPRSGRSPTFRESWFPGTTTIESQSRRSRYSRAIRYSCRKPNVVRSPRADDDVGLELVDLADRTLEQADLEVRPAAVEVGDLRDPEDAVGAIGDSLGTFGGDARAQPGPTGAVRGRWYPGAGAGRKPRFPGILWHRASAVRQSDRARVRQDPRLLRRSAGTTSRTRSSSSGTTRGAS